MPRLQALASRCHSLLPCWRSMALRRLTQRNREFSRDHCLQVLPAPSFLRRHRILGMVSRSHMAQASHARAKNFLTNARVAILSGILFLSGIGALIFETLWLRLSGLGFGNSVWSAALILSSFMAGLALGSALAASSKIRRWRPLYFYAVLEVLVAFSGCTIVFGLPVLGELMRPVWQTLWNYQPTLLGLRFIVSFLILLVPTT